MGEIRTPRPKYFDGGVVEFFVKDKTVYYKTLIWVKDGSKQFEFEQGKYNESITPLDSIVNRALQNFSNVGNY